jgi:hypothetical protein
VDRTSLLWLNPIAPSVRFRSRVPVLVSSRLISSLSPLPHFPNPRISAQGNRKQWIRLPTTSFSLLTSQQIARILPSRLHRNEAACV